MARRSRKTKLPRYVVFQHGRWWVRRCFPTSQRKNGKIVYIQVKRLCSPETAQRAAEVSLAIETQYNEAIELKERTPTLGEFLEQYSQAKQSTVARRTHEIIGELYDRYFKRYDIAQMELTSVKVMDVQSHYASLQADGVSPIMIRKAHQFLASAFNQAIKWEMLSRNPSRGVLLPKFVRKEATALDAAQAKALLGIFRSSAECIVLEFALETGMRPGEYLALTWDDISFERSTASVRRALAINLKGGGFELKEPKTRSSRRTVSLSPELLNRLRLHKQLQLSCLADLQRTTKISPLLNHMKKKGLNYKKRNRKKHNAAKTIETYKRFNLLFPASNGGPMSRLNLTRRVFKPALTEAGLDPDRYSLYTLRHTCATLSLAAGVNIKAVAEKLGHADLNMLLETYAHVLPSMREEATEKLRGLLYDEARIAA